MIWCTRENSVFQMKFTYLFFIFFINFLDRNEANIPSYNNRCSNRIHGKYKVTPISNKKYAGGESPVYVKALHSLIWVDFTVSSINRRDFRTNRTYSAFINKMRVVFVIPVEDNSNLYLIGDGEKLALICWDGCSKNIRSITFLYTFRNKNQMLDDGDVRKDGQYFIVDSAPMKFVPGSRVPSPVYLIFKKKAKLLFTVYGIANGLRWDRTGKYIYSANSDTGEISQYTFDEETKTVGPPTVIFSYKWCNLRGGPDSFTLDIHGNLWIGSTSGGVIIVVDPTTKSLERVIKIGGLKLAVTNCIWGGHDYKTLYVTTAVTTDAKNNSISKAGLVFRVDFIGDKVRGYPRKLIKASVIVPDYVHQPKCKFNGKPCSTKRNKGYFQG